MKRLHITPPYFSIQENYQPNLDYLDYPSIMDIFHVMSSCPQTGCDALTIASTKEELLSRFYDLRTLSKEELMTKYSIKKTRAPGYTLDEAMQEMKNTTHDDFTMNTIPVLPKPLATTYYTFWTPTTYFHQYKAREVVPCLLQTDNLGLLFVKTTRTPCTPFITRRVALNNFLGAFGLTMIAPLYLPTVYFTTTSRRPNFKLRFLEFIYSKYGFTPDPDLLLGYIYAILHHKRYRTKYYKELTSEPPRIPLVNNPIHFTKLCALGRHLMYIHLNYPLPDNPSTP